MTNQDNATFRVLGQICRLIQSTDKIFKKLMNPNNEDTEPEHLKIGLSNNGYSCLDWNN